MAPPPLPDGYQLASPGAAAPSATNSSPGTGAAPPPIPDGYQLSQTPPQDTYGATDALVHGATLGLSEPIKALGTATGDWLAGRGFDYSNAINNENAARTAYENTHPGWNLGLNVLGGFAAAPGNAASDVVAGTVPQAAPSAMRSVATNAGIGAGAGAISGAADNANSAHDALIGGAIGAGTGGLTGLALGGASRLIRPNTSPAVQTLRNAGVNLTPGQTVGGVTKYGENLVSGMPGVGAPINAAKASTFTDFSRGAVNQALAPIGEKLETPGFGREAIAEMQDKIGKAYDDASSGLGIPENSVPALQLMSGLSDIMQNSNNMLPDRAQQFQNIVRSQLIDRMSSGGGLSPVDFQAAKSVLGQRGSNFLHSSSADERDLGQTLLQTQDLLKGTLRTANPQAANALDAADAAYAASKRVAAASAKSGSTEEPGTFSPAILQSTIRQQDPTLGKRAFAAGDAMMQPYADAGVQVLGRGGPPTTTHGGLSHILGNAGEALALWGFGHEMGLPLEHSLPLLGAGWGAAKGAYSGPVRSAIGTMLAGRPSFATPLARGLLATTPGAAVASPQVYGGLLSGLPPPQTQY